MTKKRLSKGHSQPATRPADVRFIIPDEMHKPMIPSDNDDLEIERATQRALRVIREVNPEKIDQDLITHARHAVDGYYYDRNFENQDPDTLMDAARTIKKAAESFLNIQESIQITLLETIILKSQYYFGPDEFLHTRLISDLRMLRDRAGNVLTQFHRSVGAPRKSAVLNLTRHMIEIYEIVSEKRFRYSTAEIPGSQEFKSPRCRRVMAILQSVDPAITFSATRSAIVRLRNTEK